MLTETLERFAFGREVAAVSPVRTATRDRTILAGRVMLGLIFLGAGFGKLMDWSGTAAYMEANGLTAVSLLLPLAIAVEIAGALSLVTGLLARVGALSLFLFLIPTTLIFHDFWALEGAERQMQMEHFLKNLAIMGGLLLLIAHGAGKLSLDEKIKQRRGR